MPKILSIVESAYRATLEEQDDTILWLNHMLKNNGLDITILLRANAVNYLVTGQDASGLKFGSVGLPHPPVIDKDVADLIEKGVPVYYVKEDVDERGVPESKFIEGAKAISRRELPGLLDGFDHVWHW
jgi:intracellular sulfur oxidation DsrE/DsrF family protein